MDFPGIGPFAGDGDEMVLQLAQIVIEQVGGGSGSRRKLAGRRALPSIRLFRVRLAIHFCASRTCRTNPASSLATNSSATAPWTGGFARAKRRLSGSSNPSGTIYVAIREDRLAARSGDFNDLRDGVFVLADESHDPQPLAGPTGWVRFQ
jgi:hypothetical protein